MTDQLSIDDELESWDDWVRRLPGNGRPRPDYDPRIDWPERYSDPPY